MLQKELTRLDERIDAGRQRPSPRPSSSASRPTRPRTARATDTLGGVSARLGDAGVALQKDLIRAGGSMQAAEGDLAKTAAKPAADDQSAALKHLIKSRDDLAQAVESLLVELRSELQPGSSPS